MFKKASKLESRLRFGIAGPSGSGKTYTALNIAKGLCSGDTDDIYLIDTEFGSSSKYADTFQGFNVVNCKPPYHPNNAIETIIEAGKLGAQVIVLDSITHYWKGIGGCMDLVDEEAKRMAAIKGNRSDTFAAWKVGDALFSRLINTILVSPAHVIVTCRAKEHHEKVGGKVEKVGLHPECRDGFQYELDMFGMMNMNHELIMTKSRISSLDNRVFSNPGPEFALPLLDWLKGKPSESPENVYDKDDLAKMIDRIKATGSLADMETVMGDIITRFPGESDREALRPHVVNRRRELKGVV